MITDTYKQPIQFGDLIALDLGPEGPAIGKFCGYIAPDIEESPDLAFYCIHTGVGSPKALKVDDFYPNDEEYETYSLDTYYKESPFCIKRTDYPFNVNASTTWEIKFPHTNGITMMCQGDTLNVSWAEFFSDFYWMRSEEDGSHSIRVCGDTK